MLKKFLKEVTSTVVGKQAEGISVLLDSKKHVNEFLIAKKLDLTINQTRNILYKISDQGLVSSIRKKDKKKGWYTYFWKIEILKSLEFLRNILIKKIDQTNYQIKSRETRRFYVCEKCNIEFNEENALLYDFTCSECGGIFTMKDNTKILKELKKNLAKLKQELALVDEEIEKEEERIEKEKIKEIKKEEKRKKKSRILTRSNQAKMRGISRKTRASKTLIKSKQKKTKKKKEISKRKSKKKLKKKTRKKARKKQVKSKRKTKKK